MRVGLYARVSTADQHTLPLQIQALEQYVSHRHWTPVISIEETGSGTSERPQRELLIKAARKREIDIIIVWRLDRWGRSVADLVGTLKELTDLGVGFISLTEALDLTTATGRAMAGLLAVFAEFERDLLRERVKAGIAHARQLGKPHGRPKTVGYQIEHVKRLFSQGLSKSSIAKKLNISRTSVRRLLPLENPARLQQNNSISPVKKITVKLWLQVENNSQFVRGKTKVRDNIERFILSDYDMKKLGKDSFEYELTIRYETEEELDKTIYSLLYEMERSADLKNCFIETDIHSLDGEKSW